MRWPDGTGPRVLADPAFRTRHANPYNARLYTELARLGVRTRDLDYRTLLLDPPDVVHLHWPELTFLSGHRRWRVAARLLVFLLGLRLGRWRRGTRLVWTVHNVVGHEQRWSVRSTQAFWSLFTRRVDGIIGLSAAGVEAARRAHPVLASVPAVVSPHGHYRDDYDFSVSRSAARDSLGLPQHATVLAFVGQLRAYKAVPAALQAFSALDGDDLRFVVAGSPADPLVGAQVREAAQSDPRIVLRLEFLSDDVLATIVRACDALVLPYAAVLNSGSAVLGLSGDRPVVVPRQGALAELANQVGPQWVYAYSGPFTTSVLEEVRAWLRRPRGQRAALDDLEWTRVATTTLVALETAATHADRTASGLPT